MKDTPSHGLSWWGRVDLEEGRSKRWEVGPLTLWVRRLAREWWIAYDRDEANEGRPAAMTDEPGQEWLRHATLARYISRHAQPMLHVTPVLPDRPVVTRPVVPFHLCSGEEVTVFVSQPVWVRLEAGADKLLLREIDIQRLSDTWFGKSTLQGELCYASRAVYRLDVREVPALPYRAIMPVVIHNRSKQTLVLERLSLPVHYLSVYGTAAGALWTQRVSLKWEQGSTVSMDIEHGPPAEAAEAQLLCGPRREPEKGGVIRTVAALFG